MIGPWLALSLLVQGGLFSDRSPALRQALSAGELTALLAAEPVAVISQGSLSGQAHAQLILVALGTPQLGPKLQNAKDLPPVLWPGSSQRPFGIRPIGTSSPWPRAMIWPHGPWYEAPAATEPA